MTRSSLLLLALVGAYSALLGCDGGSDELCVDDESACEILGASRCLAGNMITTCNLRADGCLVWVETERCWGSQSCESNGMSASCVCTESCHLDDSRCDEEVLQLCAEDEFGCLSWVDFFDCIETDETCEIVAGEARCGGCIDSCDGEGDRRCSNTLLQRCEVGEEGCLRWLVEEDCSAHGATCDDRSGSAFCTELCVDRCEWEGESRCVGGVVELCELVEGCLDWIAIVDCGSTGSLCEDSTGAAMCLEECHDSCTLGEMQCRGTNIESCRVSFDGCNRWAVEVDCNETGEDCESSYLSTTCVPRCENTCPMVGTTSCRGTVIESCDVGTDGCRSWVSGRNCADSEEVCHDGSGVAACVEVLHDGNSCESPTVVESLPFELVGDDFQWDFSDKYDFAELNCTENPGASEAVFRVNVAAGTGLMVSEHGGLDADIMMQTTCGGTQACIDFVNIDEHLGARYVSSVDTDVYIVVEADNFASSFDYDIRMRAFELEGCADGVDNDIDGLVDCDDDECFGGPHCGLENNCSDSKDNDDDGLTDCYDLDCASLEQCEPARGVFEFFQGALDTNDLEGQHIIFSPNEGLYDGYSWSSTGGVTDFVFAPGSGDPSTILDLGDDTSKEYLLTSMGTFNFYGVEYSSIFVGSNGYVTFGEAFTRFTLSRTDFFSTPIVAASYCDLDPSSGTVVVDELDESVVITFDDVPRLGGSVPNDFQIILNRDGAIELVYVVLDSDSGMAGVGGGIGIEPFPPETNFHTSTAEVCDDGVDNDGDADIDCEDENCFGLVPCDIETYCDDSIDNDGDRLADCDDSDCHAELYCIPESACDDGLDNDIDGETDCADTDCDLVGACEITETSCGDLFDNDGDGDFDCFDLDCFGTGPCGRETACNDGADNDLDFVIDCADLDCSTASSCEPPRGVYEFWEPTIPLELEGLSLLFQPDAGDPNGYFWLASSSVDDFPLLPGTGTVFTDLSSSLGDDAIVEYVLSMMGPIDFYGSDYFSFFVSSNGYITFGSSFSDWNPRLEDFFSKPVVAVLYTDLHPQRETDRGGLSEITVDEFTDRVVVTYRNISRYRNAGSAPLGKNDVQVVINGDGSIELHFVTLADPSDSRNTMVGIGSGGSGGAFPTESDFAL